MEVKCKKISQLGILNGDRLIEVWLYSQGNFPFDFSQFMRTCARAWDDISKKQVPSSSQTRLQWMLFMEWKQENTMVSRLWRHLTFVNTCELIV